MATQDVTEPAHPQGAHRDGRHGARRQKSRAAVPALVWVATALHVGVMVVFALLYPAYWAFDETGHVSRVLAAQNGRVTPTPGAAPYVTAVAHSYTDLAAKVQPPFITHLPAPRADRPSMISLGGAAPYEVPGGLPNQLAQHPPGYYLLAAGVLDIVPGSANFSWDQTVGLIRLFDVLLLAPIPLLCWATARRFARPKVALAAAFAPALIPGLERLGGSTNNDNPMILLVGVFTLLITRVLHGDNRVRTGVAVGACVAAALLVKGFALVLPAVALVAYLVAWRRSRVVPWRPFLPVVVGSAIGGLWWLRNLLVYNAIQPAGLTRAQADQVWPPLPKGTHGTFPAFVHRAVDVFSTDFWGALGLAAPPSLPGVITVVASVLVGVLFVLPFVSGRRCDRVVGNVHTAPGSRLVDLGVLVLPTLLVLAPLLVHAWADYHRTGQPIGIQGRYLYVGLVGLVAICAAGVELIADWLPRLVVQALPLLACVLAIAIEWTAIWTVLVKLWLPASASVTSSVSELTHAIGARAPWPGPVTIGLFAFAACAALVAVVASTVEAMGRRAVSS
jgi:4-amino-4-deoxy-L-arabinose transferase-like glycosyltransferase